MASTLCDLCQRQPKGIEGHVALGRAHGERPAGAPAALFQCAKCSAQWSRSYVGDGVFLWHRYTFDEAGLAAE